MSTIAIPCMSCPQNIFLDLPMDVMNKKPAIHDYIYFSKDATNFYICCFTILSTSIKDQDILIEQSFMQFILLVSNYVYMPNGQYCNKLPILHMQQ